MKKFFFALLFIAPLTQAAPVLNKNAAIDGSLNTIYPDHRDVDLFYYLPESFEASLVAFDKDSRTINFGTVTDAYTHDLADAMAAIRKVRPKAKFKRALVEKQTFQGNSDVQDAMECEQLACRLTISEEGMRWYPDFMERFGAHFYSSYEVRGVMETPTEIKPQTLRFGVPVRVRVNQL